MKRLRLLPLLLIGSSALAAPLLTTTASVAEGNFCKTYACALVDRQEVAPETMGLLYYHYQIKGGALSVGRTHDKAIISGTLTIPAAQWNTAVVQDFFRNFTGMNLGGEALRRCVRLAIYTGNSVPTSLMKGRAGQMNVEVTCLAVKGGQVALTVGDANFQPR
ncbi:hypothetical protein [Deinococcus soli (ex Cha et al. 2016)]|uniref:hypothetical protein n=1 Tax=Deinococcus soli (ex Cha et al. 2016) TaxID=1309411 RepID=UPI0016690E1F|nr:hypothetical protein [Deinococcus soli (ex Cha et al. 2016)]GGB83218.1 hypothetical protein GCM10008019_44170 [Deinococcus soli (ex Cha et al. 2016)]